MYAALSTLALTLQALKLWQLSKQQNMWNELCKDDEMMEITEQLQKYNGVVMCNQMYPSSVYSAPSKSQTYSATVSARKALKKTHLQMVRTEGLEQAKRAAGPFPSNSFPIPYQTGILLSLANRGKGEDTFYLLLRNESILEFPAL